MSKTRDEILNEVLSIKSNHIILSAGTGVGKTRIALEKVKQLQPTGLLTNILVVTPTNAIKKSWQEEIFKWDAADAIFYTFTTYASLHKYADCQYDMVIFDEGHHITERVLDIIRCMRIPNSMILSATIKPSLMYTLKAIWTDLKVYRVKLSEAIESDILPDPKIILIPLQFNVKDKTEMLIKNPKATRYIIRGEFSRRNLYQDKQTRYEIPCTEQQYYLELDTWVDWYKRKAMGGNQVMKNLWLHKAGERLKWLATKKNIYVKEILKKLKDERTLTFCASIEQTEQLGSNCIHSKNRDATTILNKFNSKEIKHITAVAMLDEGVNLAGCKVGIFANINSSERIQIQRVGRILRHDNPIIIIPYFKNSREEEIVTKMLTGYNPELITTIPTIENLSIK